MKTKKALGFTLIELVVYIAILSVVTIMVADSFLILNKGRGGVEAKSELNSNTRFVIERIKRDVAAASALNSPASSVATSTLLDLTVASSSIKYTVSANKVTRQVDAQTPENISSDNINFDSLYFARVENTNPILNKKRISVEINISAYYNSLSPDYQFRQSEKTSIDLNQDF